MVLKLQVALRTTIIALLTTITITLILLILIQTKKL